MQRFTKPSEGQAVELPDDLLQRIGPCPNDPAKHAAWFDKVAAEIEPLRFDPRYREVTAKVMALVNLGRSRRS